MAQQKKQPGKFKAWQYYNDWLKYVGEVIIRISSVGDVISNHIKEVKPPKKHEYY